jgi:Rad3-related DNA helicase
MYSATLLKEEVLEMKRVLQEGAEEIEEQKENKELPYNKTVLFGQGYAYGMIKQLEKCNKEMLVLKKECENCRILDSVEALVQPLARLQGTMESYLEENEEGEVPEKEPLLDLYFKIKHFLEIYELVDEKYVKYSQRKENGEFLVKLFCVDPSTNLKECMQKGRSSVLFSATFLPIQYYKALLGGEEKDYEVYANSVFDPEKRGLFIANDVTSKYTRRSEEEFVRIAQYIQQIVTKRHGNYMVFCPSYAFLEEVYGVFQEYFATEEMDCVLQSDVMNEADREEFLHLFEGNMNLDIENALNFEISYEEDRYLIGFCVLGGIFSEGIDLKHDSLIGAIVIGTGLPQVCFEREILKNYFDDNGGNGFDYAYRFPGMNKVLQAAGRVIRTSDDIGIIALLDERFLQSSYVRLFPREWDNYHEVGLTQIEKKIERFWDSWL